MIQPILGNLRYPKSDVLVCPLSLYGKTHKGDTATIINNGGNLKKEIKEYMEKNKNLKIGDCFITKSCRWNRKSVRLIFHTIISKYPNDYLEFDIIQKCLENVFKKAKKEKITSIALPPIGIEDLEKNILAKIIINVCENYSYLMHIKIISYDKVIIEALEKYKKEEDIE